MPFFALCIVFLIGFLPEGWPVTGHVRRAVAYYECREKVIKWHRTRLEKLDPVFRLQQESMKLAFARARARDKGIGLGYVPDPEHPTIVNFLKRCTK